MAVPQNQSFGRAVDVSLSGTDVRPQLSIAGPPNLAVDTITYTPLGYMSCVTFSVATTERWFAVFDFTEEILIDAPQEAVWRVIRDVDGWWLASNAEHESLERLDSRPVTEVGAKLRIREKIGGIPGKAVGTITSVEPDSAVTWEAEATYRWLGIKVTVDEGVTWRVQPQGNAKSLLSARVWATSPRGALGRLAAIAFVHLLNGEQKDREHARTELRYLKRVIEGADPGAPL
jgi:uncharacterized protein YndB with AHSA1/START domain